METYDYDKVVVTRHPALVDHICELGLVGDDYQVITHVTSPEQIRGKHVIGVLPLHLAAEARKVTVIPLTVPEELRGQELTLRQVRDFSGMPETYCVLREE